MSIKFFACSLVIFSLWNSLFAPFVSAQNTDSQIQSGLQFRISEGVKETVKSPTPTPVQIESLSQTETDAIFQRLPQMIVDAEDKGDFRIRSGSLKPPRTGKIIPMKFPADQTQKALNLPKTTTQLLEIERFSPTGNVSIVTDLSITFSQPMIAVSSQSEASENIPVNLSPSVKGKWRWLGTQTLIFDAETRFPMATKFTATIPKNTKSAIGGILTKGFNRTFSTPPPKVEIFAPKTEYEGIFPAYAIMVAKFSQEIDEKAILPKISVTANGKRLPIQLITGEVDGSYTVVQQLGQIKPKHWLAFRTIDLLPLDAEIKVVFEKGLPSGEGVATSEAAQSFSFKTLAPLKFVKSFCGYNQNSNVCEPSDDFRIQFNHSLFPVPFEPSQVKIEPNIEDVKIIPQNNEIYIQGRKKPNTTYKVTISGSIKDFYKQPLGKDIAAIFNVGIEAPQFFAQGEDFITLDPKAKPIYPVYSSNYESLDIKLYAVKVEDYKAFYDFQQNDDKAKLPAIGKLVFDKKIKIKAKPDEYIETKIDINPALTESFGHAILIIQTPDKNDEPTIKWLQKTNIGLNAVSDYEKISVFASDLRNGKPLENVQISLPSGKSETTNESGIGEIKLPEKDKFVGDWLIAKQAQDSAILRENEYYGSRNDWVKEPQFDGLRWFVFDDRKMYRPNEEVSIKGYVRKVTGGKSTDIAALGDEKKNVQYVLRDSRNVEILKGTAQINAFGAFDFKLKLPESINLGNQHLEFWSDNFSGDSEFQHTFQAQEFRRPEFEVSAKVESSAPFFVGDSATISVEAKYYSGGFLQNAETKWNVTATPTNYTPPNRDDFTFGKFVAWWRDSGNNYGEKTSQKFVGKTDSDGKHRINLDFVSANPARPYTIEAEANVQDVNRQTFAGATSLLIHPSTLYVGIRTPKTFVNPNEKLKIETITTDIDGKTVVNITVSIVAELKDWKKIGDEWKEVLVDTQTCQIKSADTVASCEIAAKQGGIFTIKASISDSRERRNESELTVWVAGANSQPSTNIEEENVELIPDKEEYLPNEIAEILVNAPFFPAEGVMTLERNGIVKTERFSMNEASTVLKIPIEESYLPNVHVKIDLVGATQRIVYDDERDAKLAKRPAFASGELNLSVSTVTRKLNVTAEPIEKTLEPGGETKINVEVKDFSGNASANTEVAVVAVDESVLALTNYKIGNPLDAFYPEIDANVSHYHSRENILLSYPDDIGVGFGNGVGDGIGDGDGDSNARVVRRVYKNWVNADVAYIITEKEKNQIRIRRNFDALAIFSPSVMTDENGKATVNLKLPDNLTRYRITAVAVTKSKQFGLGESSITAKQSLQVRLSAPRFMNFGDKIELPVVLQNQTEKPLTVNVAIRSSNAILTSGNGRKVTVAANDRVEIRFPVSSESAGIARFQIGATSGNFSDAAEIEFPVYTPATTETFATYGTTEANGAIVQTISAPKDVYSQFGGLEITTSSTQLQELTDAFIYLQNYPFECSEQISSRVLSVAALRDILTAFEAKDLPSKDEIEAKMKSDIARLQKLQHADGGFSFWRNDDESFPFVSVHVAHAIARAKAKGYEIPNEFVAKSLNYLKNIESKYPDTYSEESRWAISAYSLYVRDLLGDKDAAKAKNLLTEVGLEKLSAESIGWILSVLADDKNSEIEVESIKQNLLNRVTETAGNAHFVTNYKDGEYVLLSSERRADGVILEALLKAEPGNSLIPKIVRGLLANKVKGRWQSTQENAFVLLALDKYFQIYEKTTPNFVAKIWLENAFAGEQKFVGRSTDSNLINVPMNYLQAQNTKQNLILDKQGEGRLYYRIGLKYALKNLKADAADYGFAVTRTYEAIDNATDVKQNSDGVWTFKSGSRVRVNVQMIAPTRRYHVALVDNLPAGIEIINPELAVSGNAYLSYSDELRKRSFWFNHQNFRDNRAEAFTTLLSEGVWNYSYLARATTPGNFVVPSAKAEEMYAPETFGRSKTDFVKVE